MKIIIAGAGEVGTHLAKMLSQEKQDIILMDPNEERLNFTNSSMEILPMVGNPTSIRDLEEAGIRKADLFVSVTHIRRWRVSTITNICSLKTRNCLKKWGSIP